ncbi:MAG TPA: hypothetical protein VMR98_06285, partial [Candidatus Polarisedimenticolaceae bacterium]|nr:hypothetical protein [Candidatus Polarisedimenticolaceae bacterium]
MQTAAVLTVLGSAPPDGTGGAYFRPPYVGTDKPLYKVSQLQTQLLPSLSAPASYAAHGGTDTYSKNTIAQASAEIQRLQLDHKSGFMGRNIHPRDNLPDYGADDGRNINNAIGRLYLDDSISAKLPLLVHVVQGGIDRYTAMEDGQVWIGGGGYDTGKRHSVSFTAMMLDDPNADSAMRARLTKMKNTVNNTMIESDDNEAYLAKDGKTVIFGGASEYNPNLAPFSGFRKYEPTKWGIIDGTNFEDRYWEWASGTYSPYSFQFADPYGYIDGGVRIKDGAPEDDNYQNCCIAQLLKGAAMSLDLIPKLREYWGPNADNVRGFADRWVKVGPLYKPDPCAPIPAGATINSASYRVTWGPAGPKPRPSTTAPDCIRGAGRFPQMQSSSKADGGSRIS